MNKPTLEQNELMNVILATIEKKCIIHRKDYDYVRSLVTCHLLIMDKINDFKVLGGKLEDIEKAAVNGAIDLICDLLDVDKNVFWGDIRTSIKAMDEVIDILNDTPDSIDPFWDEANN
jgi:hypothetical protein